VSPVRLDLRCLDHENIGFDLRVFLATSFR
jgi:hypothetical protein